MSLLTSEEQDKLIQEVRAEYIKVVKQRVLDRLVSDQAERIEKYSAELSGELTDKFRKLFPL